MGKIGRAAIMAAGTLALLAVPAALGAQTATGLETASGQIHYSTAEHGGEPMAFSYYVPNASDPEPAHPLIFLISGNIPAPTVPVLKVVQRDHASMMPKADADGTVLVHLALQERSGEEVQENLVFIGRVYDLMLAGMNIDPDRVYATGESGGGAMTFYMSCQMPEKLAAIAISIYLPSLADLGSCSRAQPLPVMITSGTADPAVPFEGRALARGGYLASEGVPGDDRQLSGDEYVLYWRSRNRLAFTRPVTSHIEDRVAEVHPTRGVPTPSHVIIHDWTSAEGHDLVWLNVVDGGHAIPQWHDGKSVPSPPAPEGSLPPPGVPEDWSLVDFSGPINADLDGSGTIYDFLLEHKRKGD